MLKKINYRSRLQHFTHFPHSISGFYTVYYSVLAVFIKLHIARQQTVNRHTSSMSKENHGLGNNVTSANFLLALIMASNINKAVTIGSSTLYLCPGPFYAISRHKSRPNSGALVLHTPQIFVHFVGSV
jgi:hypothetical protein